MGSLCIMAIPFDVECVRFGVIQKKSLLISPPKIKSAPTEVDAQKTQTPIVAKLTDIARALPIHSRICIFIKFNVYRQKG